MKILQFFGSWFSDVNGSQTEGSERWRCFSNVNVLLHVRAYGDSPVSLAMTHMRWLHGQSGHESTGYTRSVVQCVGGLRAWPIDSCSNKDVGRSERKTPTPCVRTNRLNAATRQDRTGQDRTGQDRTGQDKTGQDRTRQDKTRQDKTRQDYIHTLPVAL